MTAWFTRRTSGRRLWRNSKGSTGTTLTRPGAPSPGTMNRTSRPSPGYRRRSCTGGIPAVSCCLHGLPQPVEGLNAHLDQPAAALIQVKRNEDRKTDEQEERQGDGHMCVLRGSLYPSHQ